MAGRMQASAPELMDLSKESRKTLEMYGARAGSCWRNSACPAPRRTSPASSATPSTGPSVPGRSPASARPSRRR
ncbi:MAG TPA: hypothetical protein VM529_14525 [Gemmata sp.]|nr:hypothetical protein [Gemmata sp.]